MLGGAFDPPHCAHRALAEAALDQLQLDRLHIMPTGHAWHKSRALSPAQAEILTDAAVEEFERYYPVFQLVLLAGQSPVEALAAALIETAGEA